MNIFVLHKNPRIAALYHNDKHVIKQILESAQMLCTVLRKKGMNEDWMYKTAHPNHPCTLWAEDDNSFSWLCELALGLCSEYTFRYGKVHKSQAIIEKCARYSKKTCQPSKFALAMDDHCKVSDNPVECYREYYMKEKRHLADWSGKINSRKTPNWYK